jgi:phage tail tape-measure protein
MKPRQPDAELEELVQSQRTQNMVASEAIDAVAGAVAGAALGVMAGPLGMAAGAAIGGLTGAVLGHVTAENDVDTRAIENDRDGIDVEEEFFEERRSLGPPEPITTK